VIQAERRPERKNKLKIRRERIPSFLKKKGSTRRGPSTNWEKVGELRRSGRVLIGGFRSGDDTFLQNAHGRKKSMRKAEGNAKGVARSCLGAKVKVGENLGGVYGN